MFYFTGDLHANERNEMNTIIIYERQHPFTKDDVLFICGDFGFIWNYEAHTARGRFVMNKMKEHSRLCLDYFENAPWTTCFVDGNHECFPKLYEYPQMTWCGGRVHVIRHHVYHLMRGEMFTIQDKTFFAMGGAQSTDRAIRVEGESWWKEEMPNKEEYAHARATLENVTHIDYILTHCAPTHLEKQYFHRRRNKLTNFLEEISQNIGFNHWYFGHYHETKDFPGNYTCLYKTIRQEP